MPIYTYKVLDSQGVEVEGEAAAPSLEDLRETLRGKGLFLKGVRLKRGSLFKWGSQKANSEDFLQANQEMITLFRAGLSVREALELVADSLHMALPKRMVCNTTIRNILKRHGLTPASDRIRNGPTWAKFTQSHWEALVGTDFFTWEVWEPWGLTTYYVLFLIHQASRKVHIAGITTNPDGDWMKQIAKNLTMPDWGFLKQGMILLHDRGGQFCPTFRRILQNEGIQTLMLPFQSPNLNAYAERWVRSVKEECLSKMIILGEPMLRNSLKEYLAHFHGERPHQGLGRIPFPARELTRGSPKGKIVCRQRLGGILNFYFREAA